MRKAVRLAAVFLVLTLLFSLWLVPGATDNDARLDNYVNMGQNAKDNAYAIPNLFRQDTVFSGMDRFPLVVKNGVEYVPISAFILYSYVEVSYSKVNDNFFLVNNKNNRYISFNVEEEIASTYDGDLLRLTVEIFNKTRYVPARTVALVLGFTCETYDDAEKGIYAFRISDGKSKKTLAELVEPYIEENRALFEKQQDNPPSPPPVENSDPLESVAPRRVALCYSNIAYENMQNVLAILRQFGVTASFSVSHEEIAEVPGIVRQIYASGHSLLVTAKAQGQNAVECAESFVSGLDRANELLYHILKKKAVMCTLPPDLPQETASDESFVSAVENAGYIIFKPNTETYDSPSFAGGAYSISGRIKNKISDGFDKEQRATVTALLWCSDKTQYYTADVANLVNKYRQFSFCALHEALPGVN